jgi:hypothetical protein
MSASSVVKEGILYKQREHLRGWKPRYFTLDQNFLHYYLNKDDILPRNSFQICKGVVVTTDVVAKVSNGITFYPFTISHPHSSQLYHLSTTHLAESVAWARAIQAIAKGETFSSRPSNSSLRQSSHEVLPSHPPQPRHEGHRHSASHPVPAPFVEENLDGLQDFDPVQRNLTLENLSEDMIAKIERSVEKILSLTVGSEGGNSSWTPLFNRHGVIGMKQSPSPGGGGSGGVLCVRGETVMPYTIPEIYGLISLPDKRKELDPQLDTYTRMREFSLHSGTEHLLFKAIWPTAPRDFTNVTHWRLLKGGLFVTLGYGERLPDCPEQDGVVRGNLLIGGYVMEPVQGGTRVFIVVQSDVGGNLPLAITNMAAESQPMVLITLRRLLDHAHKGKQRPDLTGTVPKSSYSGSFLTLPQSPSLSTDILAIEEANSLPIAAPPPPPLAQTDDDDDRSSSDHSFTSDEESILRSCVMRSPSLSASPYLKEGVLYKQRDLLKGWLPRYFRLDSHFLHYYLHKSDVIPRKTLQINKDVQIWLDPTPRVVNGTAYFPFTISSSKSSRGYRLSSYHHDEAREWVHILKNVSGGSSVESVSGSPGQAEEELAVTMSSDETVTDEGEEDESESTLCSHEKATLSNLTPQLMAKINQSAETLMELAFGSPDDWSLLFEKRGVIGSRKVGSGIICVRGETVLPFTIPEIYGFVSRPERRKQLDSMLEIYSRVKWWSHHTGVEYLQSKGVWPTAPRDFSNITHWRLLPDGTFLTFGYSDRIDECPEKEGMVRGNLLLGGYVMQYVPGGGGTKVFLIVQLDLCGTLPTAVTNLAAQSQPMVLVTLRNLLEREYEGKARSSSSLPPRYEGESERCNDRSLTRMLCPRALGDRERMLGMLYRRDQRRGS